MWIWTPIKLALQIIIFVVTLFLLPILFLGCVEALSM